MQLIFQIKHNIFVRTSVMYKDIVRIVLTVIFWLGVLIW